VSGFVEAGFGSAGAGNAGLRRTASAVGVGTTARERDRRSMGHPAPSEPTAQQWIDEASEVYCAACGRGPWKSVMSHVVRAHGMTKVDLADAAGLTLGRAAEVFTSEATRSRHASNSAAKWPGYGARVVEASRRADKSTRTKAGAAQVRGVNFQEWLARSTSGQRSEVAAKAARTRWASWSPERRAAEVAARVAVRLDKTGHGPEFVARVRAMRAEGMPQWKIGAEMGITQSRVYQLTNDMPRQVVRPPAKGPTMETLTCCVCESRFTAVKKDRRKVCGQTCLTALKRVNALARAKAA